MVSMKCLFHRNSLLVVTTFHFTDYSESVWSKVQRRYTSGGRELPREMMLQQVIDSGRDRPDGTILLGFL